MIFYLKLEGYVSVALTYEHFVRKKKDFKTNVSIVKDNARCKWEGELIKEFSFRKMNRIYTFRNKYQCNTRQS